MPLVSVIIPTYNRSFCLGRAIDSVLAQTFKDWELVVVDDGSTDRTGQLLESYSGRLRSIRQANRGVCAARNRGIAESSGAWVAFLDSDDVWLPGKLELQIQAALQHPECCVHTTNASLISEDGEESSLFAVNGYGDKGEAIEKLDRPLRWQIQHGVGRIQCLMARREPLVAAGMFRTDHRLPLFEDQDLACRLALRGPWTVHHKRLVRIVRAAQDENNLSRLRGREAVGSLETLVQLYERLLAEPGLDRDEGALVRQTHDDYLQMLGMRLLGSGRSSEARRAFAQALRSGWSARCIAKWLLTALPSGAGPALARKWESLRDG